MKKLLRILTLGALAFVLPVSGPAAEKKMKATPAATPAPAEGAKKPAPESGVAKATPMFIRIDAIDAATKTLTHKKKDGTELKLVVTNTTTIMNGEASAKFEDIKVGDTVSGSRLKKSPTEYDVVKITKFGVAVPRVKKADGEKKAEEKK